MFSCLPPHTDTKIKFAFKNAIKNLKGELHVDNISEFILRTTEEAKRRGLEISIASVRIAGNSNLEPVAPKESQAATKAALEKAKAIEEHSWMKVAEAARMLRVSSAVIYARMRTGQFRSKKDDKGVWLVHTSVLNGIPDLQSRSGWHTPIVVKCLQTGVIYPSVSAAAKALGIPREELRRDLQRGNTCRGLKFEQLTHNIKKENTYDT